MKGMWLDGDVRFDVWLNDAMYGISVKPPRQEKRLCRARVMGRECSRYRIGPNTCQ